MELLFSQERGLEMTRREIARDARKMPPKRNNRRAGAGHGKASGKALEGVRKGVEKDGWKARLIATGSTASC